MKPEQKMQAIVEATGKKWITKADWDSNWPSQFQKNNPLLTDLNELFRLAEELNIIAGVQFVVIFDEIFYESWVNDEYSNAETPAEALLNVLYEAIKER